MIGDFKLQIKDTESSIEETNNKIADSQKHLTAIIREIDAQDRTPILQALVSEPKLSVFLII